MSEQLHAAPQINPDANQIITVFGRKGSGKSVFAFTMFREWPNIDKLVIDPSGDADPGADIGTKTITGKLPLELPRSDKPGHHTVTRYVPDPRSSSYEEDLDRAVGLVLFPKDRRTLLWVDESEDVFPANRLKANERLFLKQSRHYYASGIICDPRPMNIATLVLSQADHVIMYDLPHPADRERIAAAIGVKPKVLSDELDRLVREEPEFSFLWFVRREHQLYLCPPLPLSSAYTHAQGNG